MGLQVRSVYLTVGGLETVSSIKKIRGCFEASLKIVQHLKVSICLCVFVWKLLCLQTLQITLLIWPGAALDALNLLAVFVCVR